MSSEKGYQLWVSADRKTLVRLWPSGVVEVAHRDNSWESWGPPVRCEEEK